MPTQAQFRVLYADTDAMGIAYYGNYLKWFEIGRSEWFRKSGTCYRELEKAGVHLPVVEAHCSYKRSAFYDDVLTIRTSFSFAGPARLKFEYDILRGDELIAKGYTVHACMNGEHKVRKPPEFLRQLLESTKNQLSPY